MKTYTLSFADSTTHTPEHPERTAKRSISWDVEYRIWPSREAMLTTIKMQNKRANTRLDWKVCA